MDGVIVDSNPAHTVALKQFCRKYGKELSEEELREKIYGRRNQDWLVALFGPLSAEQLEAYADEKEALFREIYDPTIEPVAGLGDFLEKVRQSGIPVAIATSAPRANVDFTLRKTGLGGYFGTILDSSFVSKGKPDPEIYLKAAVALGLDPRQSVVFEDSLAGVKSAKAAGCKVVGITTTHPAEELEGVDMIIRDFVELNLKNLKTRLFPA